MAGQGGAGGGMGGGMGQGMDWGGMRDQLQGRIADWRAQNPGGMGGGMGGRMGMPGGMPGPTGAGEGWQGPQGGNWQDMRAQYQPAIDRLRAAFPGMQGGGGVPGPTPAGNVLPGAGGAPVATTLGASGALPGSVDTPTTAQMGPRGLMGWGGGTPGISAGMPSQMEAAYQPTADWQRRGEMLNANQGAKAAYQNRTAGYGGGQVGGSPLDQLISRISSGSTNPNLNPMYNPDVITRLKAQQGQSPVDYSNDPRTISYNG